MSETPFGARHFNRHITLLKKGYGLQLSLTKIGERFQSSDFTYPA